MLADDPIVQILIEAAARGRELRTRREAQQATRQADEQPRRDDAQAQRDEATNTLNQDH